MGWVATADSGYEVAVEEGRVVCRTTAGRRLKTLPKQVRQDAAVLDLRRLAEWLTRHAAECREHAEKWMVRSLPVPAALLVRVWPDEAWQAVLRDLVVVPVLEDDTWDVGRAGFLRAADERGIGVVDLDGESVRLTAGRVAIPHPVLLEDLGDLREFGVELDVRQSLDQLYRETWTKPQDLDPQDVLYKAYAGGRFNMLTELTLRVQSLGFTQRGGYASCRVHEAGAGISARVWVGAGDPYTQTETGALEFVDDRGRQLRLEQVGPVAWSEGVRLAAALYAGRTVAQEAR